MMIIKISVCAATYNKGKNIERSLDSILKINLDEIVIMDNESSDGKVKNNQYDTAVTNKEGRFW